MLDVMRCSMLPVAVECPALDRPRLWLIRGQHPRLIKAQGLCLFLLSFGLHQPRSGLLKLLHYCSKQHQWVYQDCSLQERCKCNAFFSNEIFWFLPTFLSFKKEKKKEGKKEEKHNQVEQACVWVAFHSYSELWILTDYQMLNQWKLPVQWLPIEQQTSSKWFGSLLSKLFNLFNAGTALPKM